MNWVERNRPDSVSIPLFFYKFKSAIWICICICIWICINLYLKSNIWFPIPKDKVHYFLFWESLFHFASSIEKIKIKSAGSFLLPKANSHFNQVISLSRQLVQGNLQLAPAHQLSWQLRASLQRTSSATSCQLRASLHAATSSELHCREPALPAAPSSELDCMQPPAQAGFSSPTLPLSLSLSLPTYPTTFSHLDTTRFENEVRSYYKSIE